jgi:hypothetical protein
MLQRIMAVHKDNERELRYRSIEELMEPTRTWRRIVLCYENEGADTDIIEA